MKQTSLLMGVLSLLLLTGAGCGDDTPAQETTPEEQVAEQPEAERPKTELSGIGEEDAVRTVFPEGLFDENANDVTPLAVTQVVAAEIPTETIEFAVAEDEGAYYFATSLFDIATRTVTSRIYTYTEGDDDLVRLWEEAYTPGEITLGSLGDFEAPRMHILGVQIDGEEKSLIGLAQYYSDSPGPCANSLAFENNHARQYFTLSLEEPTELEVLDELPADVVKRAQETQETCEAAL